MICAECEYDLTGIEGFLQVLECRSEYNEEIDNYITIYEQTKSFCSSHCARKWI